MKIAANLSLLFTELPLLERIEAAARAGFDGVEIQFPYQVDASQLRAALECAELPLVLINVPAGDLLSGGDGLAAVPAQQPAFEAALQQALAYAQVVRPLRVNVLPGRLAEGVSRARALECLTDNLRRCAQAFNTLGIEVMVEAINPLDMPGFLINTPEHLQALLSAIDHPNVRAQYDMYHMARQGLDVEAGIAQLADSIGHVQFADVPGRGAPGTGGVDFAGAIQALRQVGYRGWLAAEYRPGADGTQASLDWLPAWRSANW